MPNRILREGILTSPRIARLSGWAEEVFYRRLMSVVDDFGRYYADHGMLRAACYPRQLNKVSDSDVGKWLTACVTAALVRVYPAQDGERYLQLLDFRQQARAKTSKFPAPDDECIADATHAQSTSEADAPVFVFGDVDVSDNSPPPPSRGEPSRFGDFWSEWPKHKRKVAEDQCRAKWKAKGCEAIADEVIAAVKAFKASDDWRKDGGEYIPAPLVWLNQGRWAAAPALKHEAAAVGVAQAESFLSQQRALDAEINTPEARERARQAAALLKNVVKRVA